eukprot:7201251-Prymnesium_polylepis.2
MKANGFSEVRRLGKGAFGFAILVKQQATGDFFVAKLQKCADAPGAAIDAGKAYALARAVVAGTSTSTTRRRRASLARYSPCEPSPRTVATRTSCASGSPSRRETCFASSWTTPTRATWRSGSRSSAGRRGTSRSAVLRSGSPSWSRPSTSCTTPR